MTTAADDLPPPLVGPTPGRPWWMAAAGLALAAAGSFACLAAAGPLHGVLFGACGVVALLTPSLAAGDRGGWRMPALTALAVTAGACAGPLAALLGGDLNGRLVLAGLAVTASLAVALAGLTATIARARASPAVASAVVTLLALAWLGWPVWLSPWLAGREGLVGWLSPAHPLLALDAAVVREGGVPWIEHRLMYGRLTVLGQHVLPVRPAGVGPAAAWHAGAGVVMLGLGAGIERALGRRRARRRRVDDVSPTEARQGAPVAGNPGAEPPA